MGTPQVLQLMTVEWQQGTSVKKDQRCYAGENELVS